MDTEILRNDLERSKHEAAISRLCDEYPNRNSDIRDNYFKILRPLSSKASIRTYLPIIVAREVKLLMLRSKGAAKLAAPRGNSNS